MAVARAEHARRVAAGFLAQPANDKRRVSRLKIASVDVGQGNNKREPVNDRHHEKVRDQPTCKARPKENRPTGAGAIKKRRFVPWC